MANLEENYQARFEYRIKMQWVVELAMQEKEPSLEPRIDYNLEKTTNAWIKTLTSKREAGETCRC